MTTKVSPEVVTFVQANGAIILNTTTVSANYTLTGQNGMSVGPVTIANGVSVTVATGSRWVVL
jgi:hypothetical protein